jgi:hypothetical protein
MIIHCITVFPLPLFSGPPYWCIYHEARGGFSYWLSRKSIQSESHWLIPVMNERPAWLTREVRDSSEEGRKYGGRNSDKLSSKVVHQKNKRHKQLNVLPQNQWVPFVFRCNWFKSTPGSDCRGYPYFQGSNKRLILRGALSLLHVFLHIRYLQSSCQISGWAT